MNAECIATEAFKHAGENIVFASGSPFENVKLGKGKVGHVIQANNIYMFPGIRGRSSCGASCCCRGTGWRVFRCVSKTSGQHVTTMQFLSPFFTCMPIKDLNCGRIFL